MGEKKGKDGIEQVRNAGGGPGQLECDVVQGVS